MITETFGSGANVFSMDFVTIGNPGNVADTTGSPNPSGSVSYRYNIGMYEVSRDIIARSNTAGGLGITLQDLKDWGGNGIYRPATGISLNEAASFVNWLNTSRGGVGAYKIVSGQIKQWSAGEAGYDSANPFRNSQAIYVIPTGNEWYKSAYGSPDGTWYDYATGSDTMPAAVAGGTAANTAVYNGQVSPADITNAGGLSAWGTMAQGGNVSEWTETLYRGYSTLNEWRGGNWKGGSGDIKATTLSYQISTDAIVEGGFRVAMIPEPSCLSLLALGGVVVALRRRR
jgi:formylglycine-generating enzyme required for sulfatase activity